MVMTQLYQEKKTM